MRKDPNELLAVTDTGNRQPEEIATTIEALRSYFDRGTTRPVEYRLKQLRRLKESIVEKEAALQEALRADLNKSATETYLSEVFLTVNEINHAIKNLRRWARKERVHTDLVQMPATSFRVAEPLGVVLIISPWNYPIQLTLEPLIGAIAAGNCAVIKPSELAPHTSAVLARLVADIFPPDFVTVVEGGPETARELLDYRFDHIFFTGGGRIARHILRAAAINLTPVTLELGGKSPCVVDRSANVPLSAKRIAFSRFLNAGQTCVAPDYVLVESSVKERFLTALIAQLREWWGDARTPPEDFSRIVNLSHFDRLVGLIEAAKEQGAKVLYGGAASRSELYVAPTVLSMAKPAGPLMEEEIFGPVLPVIEYDVVDEAYQEILSRPKPLAAYLFSSNRSTQDEFVEKVSAGGLCLNDCLSHMTTSGLPFGGVGASGWGAYHGKESFKLFSHYKSVMKKANWFDLPLRYPPYEGKQKMVKLVKRFFS